MSERESRNASISDHFADRFFAQQLGYSFANGFVRIETWKQLFHVHPQDLPQVANFAVADMHELRFDFCHSAAADIPTGKLKMNGKIGLGPTSLPPQPADDWSN